MRCYRLYLQPVRILEFSFTGGTTMSHAPEDQHHEDNSVNVTIALFFVVVLVAITFIGLIS